MGKRFRGGVTLGAALLFGGCTQLDYAIGAIPWFSTMREAEYIDPYEVSLLPPEGTVPVAHPLGNVPPPMTQAQLDSVGAVYVNPLRPSREALARGEVAYLTHCSVCHNENGDGKGPVVYSGGFPFAPAVNGATTAARPDGYLYGIVRVGRGLMPGYGSRISHEDRWAIVLYLRDLQARNGARPPVPVTAAGAGAGQGAQAVSPAANQTTPIGPGEVNAARGDVQQNATNPDQGGATRPQR